MTLTLNLAEQRLATFLGTMRHRVNRQAQVVDQQHSPTLTGLEVDIDGVGAEIALARILNVYPDLTLEPRRGGGDLTVAGVTIDVKTTRYPHGRLVATLYKQPGDVEVYALMVGQMPHYTLKGFCTADHLFAMQHIINLGHGPLRAVEQTDLLTLADLTPAQRTDGSRP